MFRPMLRSRSKCRTRGNGRTDVQIGKVGSGDHGRSDSSEYCARSRLKRCGSASPRDQALEILACLVSREGCLIREEPVKQELRRIVLARTDQEQLHPAPRPDKSRRAGTKRLLICCTASRGTKNGRYRKSRHAECQKADAAADTSQEWSAPFRRRLRKPAEHSLLRPAAVRAPRHVQRPSNFRKRTCQRSGLLNYPLFSGRSNNGQSQNCNCRLLFDDTPTLTFEAPNLREAHELYHE
jgi:hypothetical protein